MSPNGVVRKAAESRAAKTIREIFESGRPLTYIRSSEEQRIARLLREVTASLDSLPIFTWSQTEGMAGQDGAVCAGTKAAREALDFIIGAGPGIFHLKDFHEPLRDSSEIRRRLRDVHEACLDGEKAREKFVVITSATRFVPEEVERSILFLELRTPDVVELAEFLRAELLSKEAPEASDDAVQQVARTLLGLTLDEARYAVRRAMAGARELSSASLPALLEEKKLLVNRTGYLEFVADPTNLRDVGGLEGLKTWLVERTKLFEMRDSLDAEIVPKGLLLMGMPGCGKSLCVKAIASQFQLPLYRVDMTEIFSGRHGKPEGAFVSACRMMEDMAPAVLWFDEIERGLTTNQSGGEQGRIFGFFLTWMQEKTRGLFVAATANRIELLPPEMIRKGRFDEVFFVDLPNDQEQTDIFKIHLKRRGLDPAAYQIDQLAQFTSGWSGAEIEQCVVSAITRARLADRGLTDDDLIQIAVRTVPLSRTMKEQINQIRGWAFERAVRATPQGIRR